MKNKQQKNNVLYDHNSPVSESQNLEDPRDSVILFEDNQTRLPLGLHSRVVEGYYTIAKVGKKSKIIITEFVFK